MWFRNIFSGKISPAARRMNSAPAMPAGLSPAALRQLNRLRLNTGPLLPGLAAGSRPSQQRRPAAEFREHRPYTPGDDVRYVDWKASARQEHIFIRQGEHQKDAAVFLFLDRSASMAWGEPPKSRAAIALASALGYLALAQGDRLAVIPASEDRPGDSLPPLGPVRGKGQVPLLFNYLQAVQFQGRVDLARVLAGFGQRKPARGGLVLVISDLLNMGDLAAGLAAFPRPSWKVVVCHLLHPAEIDPALDGYFEFQDIETGGRKHYTVTPRVLETYRQRLQSWQGQLARTCQESNAAYALLPTNWSLESETIPHLRGMQVVSPL
jgi:uncharacterized protein (DUF58 family)